MNLVRLPILLTFAAAACLAPMGLRSAPAPTPAPAVRTNVAPAIRPPALTNAAARTTATNAAVRPSPGGTNAPAAKAGAAPGKSWTDSISGITRSPYFLTGLFALFLVGLVVYRVLGGRKAAARPDSGTSSVVAQLHKASAGKVHGCTVVHTGADRRQVWQFDARGPKLNLSREHSLTVEQALGTVAGKSWTALVQKKVNIAWLPADSVFLRVVHLPSSSFEETVSMVDLQLERLSPMPVTQVVWSIQILPGVHDGLQTVVVLVAERTAVEEFLGRLEASGFLADRLDIPALDQLQATPVAGDGAWIYPGLAGGPGSALVAWWYGGVLRNLDFITLPTENRSEGLREQLVQAAWAGEMDGWLNAPPTWHLVADAATAPDWEPVLRMGLEAPVQVVPPAPLGQLAGLTANRAATAGAQGNLMPPEFALRYQQTFVDRLWMRALLAVGGVYVIGVLIYFIALGVASYQVGRIESDVTALGPTYTNALQFKARFEVLKERQELKFAALDCWSAVAANLPEGLTLDTFNFADGKRLSLGGTAPSDQVSKLLDFEGAMRKAMVNGQPLFDALKGDNVNWHLNPAANVVTWNLRLELKRVDVQ